jgi:hypothetical protein
MVELAATGLCSRYSAAGLGLNLAIAHCWTDNWVIESSCLSLHDRKNNHVVRGDFVDALLQYTFVSCLKASNIASCTEHVISVT